MPSPALKLPRQKFIEEWQPFISPDIGLTAQLYEHADGRRHVYFMERGEDIRGRELTRDVNRIGYRVWEDGAQFLGMCVEKRLRGARLGESFLNYFMDAVGQHEAPFTGTGIIYKPLIALTLGRVGLKPASEGFVVEILPASSAGRSEVPKVHIVNQEPGCGEIVDGAIGGRFYDIVHPSDARVNYPISSTGMAVALNTRYLPQAPNANVV